MLELHETIGLLKIALVTAKSRSDRGTHENIHFSLSIKITDNETTGCHTLFT